MGMFLGGDQRVEINLNINFSTQKTILTVPVDHKAEGGKQMDYIYRLMTTMEKTKSGMYVGFKTL